MRSTLLIVDDDAGILEFLKTVLSEKYEVFKAIHAQEAFEILAVETIHLVISDVMMPEMDGFEFCKTIKSNFELSHIPVILLTAKNTIQSKIEGLETGADAYIEKPFPIEYLEAQIANLLNNRKLVREYFANSPLVHLNSMAYSKADERFLESLNEAIQSNIGNETLDIDLLARTMNTSRATLYRKIKATSDLSPADLINIIRLKRAAALLAEGDHKIYEVASLVGFSSQSNFTRSFSRQFNMSPSEYMQSRQQERKNDG